MSEYRPTEYVVDFGDYRSNRFVGLNMVLIKQNGAKLQERIVRCRDCREYNPELYRHISCELLGRYVEPDDFCSWSCRRSDKE